MVLISRFLQRVRRFRFPTRASRVFAYSHPPSVTRRVIHRVKVDGKTLEFAEAKIDSILCAAQEAIPFDCPIAWDDWIKRGIASGRLHSITLLLDSNPIGSLTYCLTGDKQRELVVTHAHIVDSGFSYLGLMDVFASKLGKQFGCSSVRFHTVRKGLIHESLKLGYNVSEIVMRKEIK